MPRVVPPPRELILSLVDAALAEDVGSGDATTLATVPAGAGALGEILAKAPGILCGLPVAREVFLRVDPSLVFEADGQDGDAVRPGTVIARVRGPARGILTGERTALNFLQHLSGIATATAAFVRRLEGTPTRLLDTRKTVPALRVLAKYAVRCGGGENHRQGLYDMILIKENHIAAAGGIAAAVRRSRKAYPALPLEVEVTTLAELEEALKAGPDRILLDNFDPAGAHEAAARARAWAAASGKPRPEVEVSGRVTEENVREYAGEGVDFVSSGWVTHSARALDLSLELRPLVPAPGGPGGTRP